MPVLGRFSKPSPRLNARRDLFTDDLYQSAGQHNAALHGGTVRLGEVLHFEQLELGQQACQRIVEGVL